ncbi:MAG TPA: hypothetical protein VMT52_12355, partial [Planctomycetota bacterium]|nr:hypothetical protein [Planctomycetota bacterium]
MCPRLLSRAVAGLLAASHLLAGAGAVRGDETPAPGEPASKEDEDLRYWLESILHDHAYTPAEAALATGLDEDQVAPTAARLGVVRRMPRTRDKDGRILVLAYPGGRHPRIGFLDGAVNPRRDTKASIFLPWDGAGYAVVDVPEAIWSGSSLIFLAHEHIPTVWDRQGIRIERGEWTRKGDGVLEKAMTLPNGVAYRARVIPLADAVDLELFLVNGSAEKLTGVRAQVCVLLKGAPGFNAQSNDNKVISDRVMAARSADGKRWIATVWERGRAWGNPPCPCVHSDPVFPDLEPGDEALVRGRVFFHEGDDIGPEIERRAKDGKLDAAAHDTGPPRILDVRRVWDSAPHNAFTDLARHHGAWHLVFREGEGHVSPDGAIRVLMSADGETWTSAARISSSRGDLRDPKITVAPDGRLHLLAALALTGPPRRHQSLVWFSEDGRDWGEPLEVGDPDMWLWRVAWHAGAAHGIGYATDGRKFIRLYRSGDGRRFEKAADGIFDRGEPNESSLVFRGDGTSHALLRRDGPEGAGQ